VLATTVDTVKRLAIMLFLTFACAALGTPGAANDRAEVRIPHLDGTGKETIVDVQPSMPGVEKFVRATPDVIPKPGEIILPPSPSATPSPPRTPKPRDY
jgi:hypothetical protein